MSAESHYRWVRTENIGKYDWSEGWIDGVELPEAPEELWEDEANFENLEGLVVGLLKEGDCSLLCDKGWDYVFDCNMLNIDRMIEKCKSLIRELIEIEGDAVQGRGMEIARIFYNEYYEWDGELAENLCMTLRHLKETKEALQKHEDWSLIVELVW